MSAEMRGRVSHGADVDFPQVDAEVFRHTVGHFASGVTVITTTEGEELFGTTASAVSSLSAEPPMMLVCLNRSSRTHDAVVASGRYAVNILSDRQGDLARHFARKGDDKFTGIDHEVSGHGLPLLGDALATIECAVVDTAVGGTHTVFLGRVLEATAREGEPLAYYRGAFGKLERVQEVSAYDSTRDWVLSRRTPLGETIDIDALASTLRVEPALVNNALIRLTAESLVIRHDDGTFSPAPMTTELVDNLYTARLIIETGVIESHLATFPDDLIARISAISERLSEMRPSTQEELTEFLDLNAEYHILIVSGARSTQLTAAYQQLNVQTVWRETFAREGRVELINGDIVPAITRAIAARDVAAAKAAVQASVEHVRRAAFAAISARGGAV